MDGAHVVPMVVIGEGVATPHWARTTYAQLFTLAHLWTPEPTALHNATQGDVTLDLRCAATLDRTEGQLRTECYLFVDGGRPQAQLSWIGEGKHSTGVTGVGHSTGSLCMIS